MISMACSVTLPARAGDLRVNYSRRKRIMATMPANEMIYGMEEPLGRSALVVRSRKLPLGAKVPCSITKPPTPFRGAAVNTVAPIFRSFRCSLKRRHYCGRRDITADIIVTVVDSLYPLKWIASHVAGRSLSDSVRAE